MSFSRNWESERSNMKKEEKTEEKPITKKELIEAREQEMQSILPNHYTVFMGVKIPSKEIKAFSWR